MANGNSNGFLKSKYSRILTLVLFAQAGVFYAGSGRENIPQIRPLISFPIYLQDWRLLQEGYVDAETQAVLKADDTLTRSYSNSKLQSAASLFVAFFKTQRTGQAPHSPKNCLPGAGWEPSETGLLSIAVPGEAKQMKVNRYVVSRGEQRSVVLYWYQTMNRVVASEYEAKFLLVADAIRYNRSDTALVRIVVPVRQNDEARATEVAVDFVRALFPDLKSHLPS